MRYKFHATPPDRTAPLPKPTMSVRLRRSICIHSLCVTVEIFRERVSLCRFKAMRQCATHKISINLLTIYCLTFAGATHRKAIASYWWLSVWYVHCATVQLKILFSLYSICYCVERFASSWPSNFYDFIWGSRMESMCAHPTTIHLNTKCIRNTT